MHATKTRAPRVKKPVFPIRALLLSLKARLLVIDGIAFSFRGKEHKYIKPADYTAMLDLGWISAPQTIAPGLLFHTVTDLGQQIAAEIEEQNRIYRQLELNLDATAQSSEADPAPAESEAQATAPEIAEAAIVKPVFDAGVSTRDEKRAAAKKSMQQSVTELLAEIKAGKSARLLDYLKFAGKFHTYSPLNQLLIASQAPHATRVAGYTTWKKAGYQVKKGSKGIAILAPRPYGKATLKNEETGEEGVTYLGTTFSVAYVFDVSQLEAHPDKPLPAFFVSLPDDQEALYTLVARAVEADSITIEICQTGRAQGVSTGGKIRLKDGLDSTNRVLTLIHEWAHEKLHHNATGRQLPTGTRECHAEAVSFCVSSHFGLHNPFSADYLRQWGNTEKELLAELEIIKATSHAIIEQIEAQATKAKESAPTPVLVVCNYCREQSEEPAITIRNNAPVCAACIELDCSPLTPDDFATPDGVTFEAVELEGEIMLPDQAKAPTASKPQPAAQPTAPEIAPALATSTQTEAVPALDLAAEFTEQVEDQVLDVLRECTLDGCALTLPARQLDRKLYMATNEVLERLGGKWNRKAKAHLFAEDPHPLFDLVLATGCIPPKNPTA